MPSVPIPLLLPALVLSLWPAAGGAQEGPSFDCRYARTATEHTICGSAELSRLEMEMYGSYLGLVEAIGERQARRIADRFLERRQACGAKEACILERLLVSQRVFERRAGDRADPAPSRTAARPQERITAPPLRPEHLIEHDLASAEPEAASVIERASATPEPRPEDFAAASPVSEPPIGEPLAAQAPPPPDSGSALQDAPAQVEAASAEPPEPPFSNLIAEAELTSSVEPAPFDTPVSWAFMDLIRHQRAVIQERLRAAGDYEGPADGTWDRATLDALQAFLTTPAGQEFDASTESGATLALDYIRSDAFAQAQGIATAPDATAASSEADPLSSTDW